MRWQKYFTTFSTLIKERFYSDTFVSNSAFLFSAKGINAVSGLAFWTVAAFFYSQTAIGVATSILSAVSLIILLTRFGFNQSLVRFLPERDEDLVFTTVFLSLNLAALLVAVIFVSTTEIWLSGISVGVTTALLVIIYTLMSSTCGIGSQTMIAKKRSKYYIYQSALLGLRPFLLPLFLFVGGTVAVLTSITIAYVFGAVFSIWIVFRMGIGFSRFDAEFVRESFRFSSSNYAASLFTRSTDHILPLMVLNVLGPESTALYYIAQMIARIVEFFPQALSTSLFVEGSHGGNLRRNSFLMVSLVIPVIGGAIITIYSFGGSILSLIGENYRSASRLLFILTISTFFVSIYKMYLAIIRVRRDNRALFSLSGGRFVLIIGLCYLFMKMYGLIGVGFGYLLGYLLLSILIVGRLIVGNITTLTNSDLI